MLKVRLQGTIRDMGWFRGLLEESREIKILRISEAYANKGTNRYFRMYMETGRIEGYEANKEFNSISGKREKLCVNS